MRNVILPTYRACIINVLMSRRWYPDNRKESWYNVLLLSGNADKDLRERGHQGLLLVNGGITLKFMLREEYI